MKHSRKANSFKPGLTNRECVFVICGCSLITFFAIFVSPSMRYEPNYRAANIMNIRNCQQAMRGHANMKELGEGDPFTREDLAHYMTFPSGVNSVVTHYTNRDEITPESADPATNWNHIWLIPSDPAGMPGGKYGLDSYADVTGW